MTTVPHEEGAAIIMRNYTQKTGCPTSPNMRAFQRGELQRECMQNNIWENWVDLPRGNFQQDQSEWEHHTLHSLSSLKPGQKTLLPPSELSFPLGLSTPDPASYLWLSDSLPLPPVQRGGRNGQGLPSSNLLDPSFPYPLSQHDPSTASHPSRAGSVDWAQRGRLS